MPLTLRRATPGDAATLSDLAARTFTETFGHLDPAEDLDFFLRDAYAPEKQAVILSHPDYAVWLLEEDGSAAQPGDIASSGPVTPCPATACAASATANSARAAAHPAATGGPAPAGTPRACARADGDAGRGRTGRSDAGRLRPVRRTGRQWLWHR